MEPISPAEHFLIRTEHARRMIAHKLAGTDPRFEYSIFPSRFSMNRRTRDDLFEVFKEPYFNEIDEDRKNLFVEMDCLIASWKDDDDTSEEELAKLKQIDGKIAMFIGQLEEELAESARQIEEAERQKRHWWNIFKKTKRGE